MVTWRTSRLEENEKWRNQGREIKKSRTRDEEIKNERLRNQGHKIKK